jgi:Flp pilus assembly protein TadG
MSSSPRRRVASRDRFGSDERGAIQVEFALITPIILLLLSGVIDLGLALQQTSTLKTAARMGAQYAMRFPSDDVGIAEVVKKAVAYDAALLTISNSTTCECPDGTAIVCSDKCAGSTPRKYVSVSVSMPYSSPLPTSMMLGNITTSGSAAFRSN